MPFITIIGAIKEEHLWAWCRVDLVGFLWTIAPLVFKYIGLKALHHLDPYDPPSPVPSSTQSSKQHWAMAVRTK